MSLIERIRDHVTVPDALDRLGLGRPNRSGKITCPFHEDKTPSFHVWDDHWYTFCCGKGGDVIDLVADVQTTSITNAIRFLAEGTSLEGPPSVSRVRAERQIIDFTDDWERLENRRGSGAMKYLIGTKGWPITYQDLWGWGIKCDSRSLLIPHRDRHGRVVGVKTRGCWSGGKAAWTGSTFTTRLYRVQRTPRSRHVAIVEGESDTWSLTRWYRRQGTWHIFVLGMPAGAGTWRDEWDNEIFDSLNSTAGRILLMLDNDPAGQKAQAQLAERFGTRAVPVTVPHNDVSEAITYGWQPPVLL